MANRNLLWAAVARKNVLHVAQKAPVSRSLPIAPPPASSGVTTPQPPSQPRVAFVSGHIDITPQQFSAQYAPALDAAIYRGDAFVLSTARGADTLALAYLRTHNVDPSRISIYMHTPRPNRKSNATQVRIDKMQLTAEVQAVPEGGLQHKGHPGLPQRAGCRLQMPATTISCG